MIKTLSDGLKGKKALITGAAGGIGAECARLFAAEGTNLILTDVNAERLEESVAALKEATDGAVHIDYLAGDVLSEDFRAELVKLVEQAGHLDFLVPAAGIYPESPLGEMTDDAWDRVFNINLKSVFSLTRDVAPLLNEGASVVNFASIAGARGSANHAHYAATKGAIVSFTKSLAIELGSRGIRVNSVAPGIIDTTMVEDLMKSSGDTILASTPLHRLGHPAEIAAGVVFLCTAGAGFITGETLHINGGFYMA